MKIAKKNEGIGRNCKKHRDWRKIILERDGKCLNCGTTKKLHVHHIIPWKINVEKRFDTGNGFTLCASCHKKCDGPIKGGWNKGLERSKEWCEKLSKSCKGRSVWNTGLKGIHFSPNTEFKKGQDAWNKGIKKPFPEKKICKDCNVEKILKQFTPLQGGKWYGNRCKVCRNKLLKIKKAGLPSQR